MSLHIYTAAQIREFAQCYCHFGQEAPQALLHPWFGPLKPSCKCAGLPAVAILAHLFGCPASRDKRMFTVMLPAGLTRRAGLACDHLCSAMCEIL